MVKNYTWSRINSGTWKNCEFKCLSFIFLISYCLIGGSLYAQSTGNYTLTHNTTGSLALDMNGSGIDMSGGTSTLVTASSDDTASSLTYLNLGSGAAFEFYFMGARYTQFGVTDNGMLTFGVAPTTNLYAIPNSAIPTLSAFANDTRVGSNGKVEAKLFGTAPNRVLVVQWTNIMIRYLTTATAGTGTWQVRLYENTGAIEYVYGAMATNSASPTVYYTGFSSANTALKLITINTGTNATNTSTTPTTNSYSASSTVTALHSTADGSRKYYRFVPPSSPTNPTLGAFTAVTSGTTTVNWTDNSNNELGFMVTRATDAAFTQNITTSTVAANGTSSAQSGLTPGTTYYYKVQAYNEGAASGGATGSQITTPAATYYWVGATGGSWSTASNWNTAADNTGSARGTALNTDTLIIDGAGTTAGASTLISLDGNVQIGVLRVTNNTTVTLQSNSTSTRSITIMGGAGDDLDITTGSTLQINNLTNNVGLAFSAGTTGSIAGTFTLANSLTFNTINTTNAVVTVTGNFNHGPNGGGITSSASTLKFAAGSNYNYLHTTATSNTIPTAEWNSTSNVNITAITTGTSSPSGNTQSFGNFTYNCPSASETMSFFTNNTVSIQGNLTVAATGTGKFRMLTSGVLNIGGNLNVSGGTAEIASTTGVVNVTGSVNLSGGTLDLTSGTSSASLKVAGAFNQSAGTFTASGSTASPSNLVEFNGSSAQNVTLTNVGANAINYRVNNAGGVNLTGTLPVNNGAGMTITNGNITGSGTVSYNATSSRLTYAGTISQTASAREWPTINGPVNVTINNTGTSPANKVTIPFDRALPGTGVLTLTAGIFDNAGYTFTLNNTNTAAIIGFSAAKYLTGAFERTLAANTAGNGNYEFPVGKSAYSLFELRGATTSAGTPKVKVESIDGNSGGTVGTGMSSLNTNRYWAASITSGEANFTSTTIRLTDTASGAITTESAIGSSATANGAYSMIGGTAPTITAGSTILSTSPAITSLPGYFIIGTKGVNMAYSSSAVTQVSSGVPIVRPATNQQIVMLQVVTTGNANALHIQGLDLTTTGVTALSDITKVTVYSTGSSSTFATTTTFGSVNNPATSSFTVSGDVTLLEGNNYFFVVYDIGSTAVVNNTVDAQIPSITIGGASYTPTTPNPAGTRTIKGPLNGDYTVGSGGIYTTLTDAAGDLYTYGVEAPVRLLLNNGSFGDTVGTSTSGVAETYPINFRAMPGANATNTVTISPATGATVTITGGNATALLNLTGVNYLVFNGSNNGTASKDLTVNNTNTTGSTVVFINGASNNSIRNCILKGVTTNASNAVVLFSTSTATTGNLNNTITANDITKGTTAVRACIYSMGMTGKYNNYNIISNNRLMDFTAYGFQDGGFSTGTLIEGNEIFQNSSQSTDLSGIYVNNNNNIFSMRISKNKIHSLTSTTTGTITGMNINAVASVVVINNAISVNNTTGNLRGIATSAGAGGTLSFYHNTVSISGATSGTANSYALLKTSGATGDNIKNNIFSNTRVSSGSGKQYAIGHNGAGTMASDYNTLYSSGNAQNIFGQYSNNDVATLQAWKDATPGDDNSVSILPNFTSVTDLHLIPGSNGPINNLGIQLTGVTGADTDIDGDSRIVATPDMGADEFTPLGCSGATGGIASAAATGTFCNSVSTTISVTGYSSGLNTTYRWQSSSDMAFTTPVDLGSETSIYSNLNTGTVTSTTYYRLKVTCGDNASADYSTVASVTIITPTIASTTPGERCGPGSVELSATAAEGTILNWYAAASGGSSLHTGATFTTPSISVTTPYYVAAAIQGAGDVAVGAGNLTGTSSPYNIADGGYGGMKGQYLFTVAELTAAGLLPGNITKLAFELTSTGATLQGFTVQMGTTALSAFGSSGDLQGGLSTVRNSASFVPANGVNTLTFDAPFNWDGTSNIIVSMSWSNNNSINTASTIRYNATSFISSQGYRRDNVTSAAMLGYTGNPGSGSLLTDSSRPKITFTGMTAGGCASARQAVTATIHTPPALTLSSNSGMVCPGTESELVTITAGEEEYDTYMVTSMPADAPWSGNSQDGFTFSPTVATVYTIAASQEAGNMCKTSATYTTTIALAPLPIVVSPNEVTICNGEIRQLTVSVGNDAEEIVFSENFNSAISGWTLENLSEGGNVANAAWTQRNSGYIYETDTYTSNDASGFIMSNSDDQGLGGNFTLTYLTSPSFSLEGHESAKLNFYHYFKYNANATGTILVSIDGGDTWEVAHSILSLQGDHDEFVAVEVDLSDYAGQPDVIISFEFYAEYGWYWAIDNISVTVPQLPLAVWTPAEGLYTDAGATTPYEGGQAETVYAKPAVTTLYTASHSNGAGCIVTDTANINVAPKQWIGAEGSEWNDPANWCGGQVPTEQDNIVISDVANQPVITGGTTISGGSLTIEEGANMVVTSGNNLRIINAVVVETGGSLTIEDNANLIQVNDVDNSGNVTVEKNSAPIFRLDYAMWSSPAAGVQTLKNFSPETLDNRFYRYNPLSDAYATIEGGTIAFQEGAGYLIRVENNHPAYVAPAEGEDEPEGAEWEGTFTGTPNNGNINVAVTAQGAEIQGFNAVGNPYASPVNVHAFFDANENNLVDGSALYFWRKKNDADTGSYARVTKMAYTANTSNDWGDASGGAFSGAASTWVLNSGQGFIVQAKSGTIHFNNQMRRAVNNGQIFRTGEDENEPAMSRMWLNVTGAEGQFAQAAIGYSELTTLAIDYGWDGKAFVNDGNASLFTLAGEETLGIQARPAFNPSDVVPLGYRIDTPGSYTISLDHVDGVFAAGQDVFLKDNLLGGITHDLRAGDYTFQTEAGLFTERFEVVYAEELGTNDPVINPNSVIVYKHGASISINSGMLEMTDVTIYDLRGRMLYSKDDINAAATVISGLQSDQQVLIVQVNTTKGRVTKRIIF